VERQSFDRRPPLPRTQIIEPDQAEGERRRGIRAGRTGDRSPTVLAMFEQAPGKCGREAVFEIRLRRDLRDVPFGQLTPQEAAQALPKDQASVSLPLPLPAGRDRPETSAPPAARSARLSIRAAHSPRNRSPGSGATSCAPYPTPGWSIAIRAFPGCSCSAKAA